MFSIYRRYVPSTGNVNFTVICDAELKATSSAATLAPVDELIAVTKGTVTKLPPAITQVVCVFSIVDGVIDEKVGLDSVAIVTDPPRETAEPLIVICPDPCSAAFATEVFGKAILAPVGTVIVSPLSPS